MKYGFEFFLFGNFMSVPLPGNKLVFYGGI